MNRWSFRLRGGQPFQKRKPQSSGKSCGKSIKVARACGSPRRDGGHLPAMHVRAPALMRIGLSSVLIALLAGYATDTVYGTVGATARSG